MSTNYWDPKVMEELVGGDDLPVPVNPEEVVNNNVQPLVNQAVKNDKNFQLSYDFGDFDESNEGHIREMQKFLTSKGYDLGFLGNDQRGGTEFWGDKSKQAMQEYANTFEEIEESNDDAVEAIEPNKPVVNNINAISNNENTEAVDPPVSNSAGNVAVEKEKFGQKLGNLLGDAWSAYKEGGYTRMDEKVFGGHLPFAKKPYDVFTEKQQNAAMQSVDGQAENAINESNQAVQDAGLSERDKKKQKKNNAFKNFKWQSPQYGNYK